MPLDWVLRGLSSILLERRKRHLEAYLVELCSNQTVLLDDSIWSWLGVDDLTQVAVKLVAACNSSQPGEVSRLMLDLEAVVASGGDANHCVHPAVLSTLQAGLEDHYGAETQAA
eukprot:3788535-Amphidinium_carterae.1